MQNSSSQSILGMYDERQNSSSQSILGMYDERQNSSSESILGMYEKRQNGSSQSIIECTMRDKDCMVLKRPTLLASELDRW